MMAETDRPSVSPERLAASPPRPIEALHHVLGRLRARYQRAQQGIGITGLSRRAVDERVDSLTLAEAVLRHLTDSTASSSRPKQVAVIGPTQVGKSTVVNLLLGIEAATVSPLAGFTQYPHAFALDLEEQSLTWLASALPHWSQLTPAAPRADSGPYYSVSTLSEIPGSRLGPCLIWDTSDFDSVGSRAYRLGVLEIAALSDVLLLVLSKEKYADNSVWSLATLLAPLARPTLVCLNKVSAEAGNLIVRSLRQKLAQHIAKPPALEVITLPYDPELVKRTPPTLPSGVARLRRAARELLDAEQTSPSVCARALVSEHWKTWIAPVTAEHSAHREWALRVHAGASEALAAYCRDYLEHPERYDALRQTVVQLLELLELPGVSKAAARARQTITWPVRRLLDVGRGFATRRSAEETRVRPPGNEGLVLEEILRRMLTTLTRDAARESALGTPADAFWRALERRLIAQQTVLEAEFRSAINDHHQSFQPQIEAAARDLYGALQDKPAVLNSLRAARATTDTAGVVLALKTGGLGANDLLLAPAMLAVTSMLTESVVGQYLLRVANELKRKQKEAVEKCLLGQVVQPRLVCMGDDLDDEALFNVPAESLATARQALA